MTISYRLKLTILITSISVLLTSVSVFSLYHFTYRNMLDTVSKNLRDALKLSVLMFDEEDKLAMKRLRDTLQKEVKLNKEDIKLIYSGGVVNKFSKERQDELHGSEDFKRLIEKLRRIDYSRYHGEVPFEEFSFPENAAAYFSEGNYGSFLFIGVEEKSKSKVMVTMASPGYMPVEDFWQGNPIGTIIESIFPADMLNTVDVYVHDEVYTDPFYTLLFGFTPIYLGDEMVAALELDYPVGKELRRITWLQNYSFILIVISFVSGILLSSYISGRMTKSLNQLHNVAEQIKEHNYEVKLDIQNRDEFGMLGESFNQMAEEVNRTMTGLQESSYRLRSITADMHDGVGAVLTSIQISSRDSNEAVHSLAKRGMAQVRFLMDAMEYDDCDYELLVEGIELLAIDIFKPQGVKWTLKDVNIENREIPFQMYLDIQRIAREIFNSIISQPSTSHCAVELFEEGGMFFMNISGDGKHDSFDYNNVKLKVEHYDGSFSVKHDSKGFTVKTFFKMS